MRSPGFARSSLSSFRLPFGSVRSRLCVSSSSLPVLLAVRCSSQVMVAASSFQVASSSSSSSILEQRRYCSRKSDEGDEDEETTTPTATATATGSAISPEQNGHDEPRLSLEEVLKTRWGCASNGRGSDVAANAAERSTSQQSGQQGPTAAAAALKEGEDHSAQGGGGRGGVGGQVARIVTAPFRLVGDALRQFVRHVTRAQEREEEEEMRRLMAQLQQRGGGAGGEDDAAGFCDTDVPESSLVFGGVTWAVYERLDIALKFNAPFEWNVSAKVSENFVGLQCSPRMHVKTSSSSHSASSLQHPRRTRRPPAPIHGLSVSTFLYHAKVPVSKATSADLLTSFLAQFHRSVGRSSVVLGSCSSGSGNGTSNNSGGGKSLTPEQQQQLTETTMGHSQESIDMCRNLVKGCIESDVTVCELQFRPPAVEEDEDGGRATMAHALCKVFFHRGRRRHTVVIFAVPDDEWLAVRELVQHAVVRVCELQGGDSRLATGSD